MGQNTSHAVMAQRRDRADDALDDFPTPPWATRVLIEVLRDHHVAGPYHTVREPAANRGVMARTLAEFFGKVLAADVADYGVGLPVEDYLFPGVAEDEVDWTITNPPFRLAEAFIAKAMATSRVGTAMLVRTAFLEGEGRFTRLFGVMPPDMVIQFTERVVMHESKLVNPNVAIPTFDKKKNAMVMRKPSTATAYCWAVWMRPAARVLPTTRLLWTGICRERLERPGDYPTDETILKGRTKE